jgi:signal transduction histidine kinase
MMEDREGHLWLGGGQLGLGASGLRQLKNPEPVPFDGVALCALADQAGNVWLGTPRGLVRLRGEERQVYDRTDGLLSDRVYAIAPGQDGSLWLGLYRGLGHVVDGKVDHYSTADGLSGQRVQSVCQHSSGGVWIGFHDGGVDRWDNETFTPVKELEGVNVRWFHEASGGELWMGTNQGLFKWTRDNSPQRVDDPVLDGLGDARFRSHYEDDQGSLWLGTSAGLCRINNGQFSVWTDEVGLHPGAIHMVLEDNRGRLWMGGPQGVFFVPKQAFDDLDAGRIERLECRMLAGLPSGKELANGYPKACKTDDGSVWLVGRYETVKIPHGAPNRNPLPPPVHIEQVRVDGNSRAPTSHFEFTAGRRQLALHYTAPTYRNPEGVRFRHRLHGLGTDWIDAGGERVAHYADLRPGDYEFQVIAENGHGVWNEEGASLRFTVLPRWFERTWFRVLCVLGMLGVVFGVSTLRIKAVHARHAERTQYRDDLARVSRVTTMGELAASIAHEINQPLCAILNNANSGQRILAAEKVDIEDARGAFDDIGSAAKRASDVIQHIRELLANHATERVPVDVNRLLDDSLELVKSNLDRKRIGVFVDAEPTLPRLLGDRVQLQQVLINLLLNAAGAMEADQSEPRTATIQASHVGSDVKVSVRDTGVGFEEDQNLDRIFDAFHTTKPGGIGMGLAISKSIVEAHGGRIWAERNADRGATFRFTIPAIAGTENA